MVTSMVRWEDVQDTIGRPLTTAEQKQVELWIADAEVLITAELGAEVQIDRPVLEMVVREAVALRLRRPDGDGGPSSITVTADDGSVTRRYGENDPEGAGDATKVWWFRDIWWTWLSPALSEPTSAAFTIHPGRPSR